MKRSMAVALILGVTTAAAWGQEAPAVTAPAAPVLWVPPPPTTPPRFMEKLGRGVVAINQGGGKVFLSWRVLGTESDALAFNVYRKSGAAAPVKLNAAPLTKATWFQDTTADLTQATEYTVRGVLDGREQEPGAPFKFAANAPARPYLSIPIQKAPQSYSLNDASTGDVDGDGEYEIILHLTGRSHDNAQNGPTDPPVFQCYKLDGTLLWTINLGRNIREGAHYTHFQVYDYDGDGKAEIIMKTADGTTDGAGKVIGDANKNYVNSNGMILDGPEFLTVFEGATGKALYTTDYIPPRGGDGSSWGDRNGNRVDRYLACTAYLDGIHPSVVMCRGYYTRAFLAAYNWDGKELKKVWFFDTDDPATPENRAYRGQGNHNLSVADVDGDGKDEIVYGACCIDHNGKGLYNTNLRHGDAMHLSVLDPTLPGLQVFQSHETPSQTAGAEFRDANTGKLLWGNPTTADNGRGMTADIDPRHLGSESWSAGVQGLFDCKGNRISQQKPRSCNFAVWWDGGLLRNLLDANRISKWNWETGADNTIFTLEGCTSNNGTKSTPCLSADLLGDWREEVLERTTDNREMRIYTTTAPTEHRIYTLMHDPVYRLGIAWQNTAYNQPPHTGFWLGDGMKAAPKPNIRLVEPKTNG
jgi:rhamnogalacturonan endolyase